jgi:single-strand DNA-binding protein
MEHRVNIVALIGNLAADPELRTTTTDKTVCTFRLAVSRPGTEGADFFTVVTWERQARICGEYLRKGRRVAVEGRMHHSTWEVEGARRSKVEVVASRVQLLGPPKSERRAVDAAAEPVADLGEVGHSDDFAAVATSASGDFAPVSEEAELMPV